MPRLTLPVLAAAGAALALAAPAGAQTPPPPGPPASQIVSTPSAKTLYRDGPSGRYLVDGPWLLRVDPADVGRRERWQRTASTAGWSQITVPNVWNARDESVASYLGSVGWYRKDLRLPRASSGDSWVLRFESVNYRASVWLNGRLLGSHAGFYEPFELRVPRGVLRRGVNRLVIRADSRRTASDFPPAEFDERGRPQGGWWNYGGLQREVYLRRVDDIDLQTVDVRPRLSCTRCAADVRWTVVARNMGTRSRTVTISGRFGPRRVSLGRASIAPGTARTFSASARIPRPRLWRPSRPALYDATLTASVAGRRVQTFTRKVGVRSVKVDGDGRLTLNGRRVNLRGVGLHNDSIENGFAVDNATRDRQLGWARELGSGIIRLHYPPHPQTLEQADRLGTLVWAEVPVWQVEAEELAKPSVRTAAVNAVEEMVRVNRNHPSVAIWSVGNELGARVGPAQAGYIREATEAAKALDPDRPVGIAVAAGPTVGCQAGYAPLDLVGINDYFGWYPGGNAVIADRELLSAYLDTVRACYRRKAVMITEFGAEANRDGPVEERGTWAFQRDFMNYHLGVFATKPWLSGAIWWALQEFRVRPDWDGGNPRPQSPTHQKGVVAFDGTRKPTFADLQRLFRSVNQFGG